MEFNSADDEADHLDPDWLSESTFIEPQSPETSYRDDLFAAHAKASCTMRCSAQVAADRSITVSKLKIVTRNSKHSDNLGQNAPEMPTSPNKAGFYWTLDRLNEPITVAPIASTRPPGGRGTGMGL